jgi:enoyl-CoA hydratase
MQLAVACDLRIAAPSAVLGIPAAKLGVILSAANVRRLAELVGQGAARDLLLTARAVDVEEASRIGLVQRVAEDAREAALVLAGEIAALAPISVQGHKRALRIVGDAGRLDEAALAELEQLEVAAFASADLQEGLTAFGEKRPPRFEGR